MLRSCLGLSIITVAVVTVVAWKPLVNVLFSTAGRLRKVPPRKPDGEIKPYSLMEREAVREEQRALPWPLSHSAAPPLSPPPSGSSPCSPSRPRQRPDPALAPAMPRAPGGYRSPNPQSPLIDSLSCREKRTSQHGLVARSNLYSRHSDSQGFGLLLETQQNTVKLPGVRSVMRDRHTDTGGQADPLGNTDRKESLCSNQTSLTLFEPGRQVDKDTRDPDKGLRLGVGLGKEPLPPKGGGVGQPEVTEKREWGGGRSWTVGESCNAQWVRRKQDQRSTRPW